MNTKFSFIKQTLIFSIFGMSLLPGFTAVVIVGLQILLTELGVECSIAIINIWTVTSIAGVVMPILFYRHIVQLTVDRLRTLKTRLWIFNLLEYTFIQSSFLPLFTTSQRLCYGHGGQNGLELILTAWMAVPILIAMSFIFHKVFKRKLNLGIDS